VHGFLIEHPDGAILVDSGVQVPLARSKGPGQGVVGGSKTSISTEARCEGGPNVSASKVVDLRKRRIERVAVDLARQLVSKTYLIVEVDELDSVDE
jgi:hypothetical protein